MRQGGDRVASVVGGAGWRMLMLDRRLVCLLVHGQTALF